LLIAIAGVLAITFVGHSVVPVNATTAGLGYLLFVLVIASTWGFVEALVSSIAATLVFNFFFLPPVGTFTIADPQNWAALFSFLVASLIASRLSTKARHRALEAEERQQDVERLYTFGRAILLIDDRQPFVRQLAARLADAFELEAVALFESRTGEIYRAGPVDLDGMDSQLREAAVQGTSFADPERKRVITAVRLGSEPIASLALQGGRMPDSVLQSVANLVAIGLERERAENLAHEMEAARRSEQLRNTLIDAMAHEFKTPLTSIRAATSALLADPDSGLSQAKPLLQIADEEAANLEELIDNALDMAQLDGDRIRVDLEISNLDELVGGVVASMKTKAGERRMEIQFADPVPPISIDRRLMKIAIKQILDNALKYSSSDTPVAVRAFRSNGTVALEITNHGKGIPLQEQTRIFDRFYRGAEVRERIPGSGLGLSIAYRILQAHGGDLTIRSQGTETTFRMELPVERK